MIRPNPASAPAAPSANSTPPVDPMVTRALSALAILHNPTSTPAAVSEVDLFLRQFRSQQVPLHVIFQLLQRHHPAAVHQFGLGVLKANVSRFWTNSLPSPQKQSTISLLVAYICQFTPSAFFLVCLVSDILQIIIAREWKFHLSSRGKIGRSDLFGMLVTRFGKLVDKRPGLTLIRCFCEFVGTDADVESTEGNKELRKEFVRSGCLGKLCVSLVGSVLQNDPRWSFCAIEALGSLVCLLNRDDLTLPGPGPAGGSMGIGPALPRSQRADEALPFLPLVLRYLKNAPPEGSRAYMRKTEFVELVCESVVSLFSNLRSHNLNQAVLTLSNQLDVVRNIVERTLMLQVLNKVTKEKRLFSLFDPSLLFSQIMKLSSAPATVLSKDQRNLILAVALNIVRNLPFGRSTAPKLKQDYAVLFRNLSSLTVKLNPHDDTSRLKSRFHAVFVWYGQNFPEPCVEFVLSELLKPETYANVPRLQVLALMLKWGRKQWKTPFRKRCAAKYEALLRLLLSPSHLGNVEAQLALPPPQRKIPMAVVHLLLGMLKLFDIPFGVSPEPLQLVVTKIMSLAAATTPHDREFRKLCLKEWIEMCSRYHLYLMKFFPEILNLKEKFPNAVADLRDRMLFLQGCVIVIDKSPNAAQRSEFISFLLKAPLAQLLSDDFAPLVRNRDALLKYFVDGSHFDLQRILFLLATVLAKLQRASAARYLNVALPTITNLVRTLHSVYDPSFVPTLPPPVQQMIFLRAATERLNVAKRWSELKRNAYRVLGYCTEHMPQFWTPRNLVETLSSTIFFNCERLPYGDLSNVMEHFLVPFIRHCPPNKHNSVLYPVLNNLLRVIASRVNEPHTFPNEAEEIVFLQREAKLLKTIGNVLQFFRFQVDNYPLFEFLKEHTDIFFIFCELSIKMLHSNSMKYYYLYHDFLLSVLPEMSRNGIFEEVLAFHLLRALIFVLNFSRDAPFHQSLINLISRIYVTYSRSRFSNYIFRKVNSGAFAELQKVVRKRDSKLSFKAKKRRIRRFLLCVTGKGRQELRFSLDDLGRTEHNAVQRRFMRFDRQYVMNALRQKRLHSRM